MKGLLTNKTLIFASIAVVGLFTWFIWKGPDFLKYLDSSLSDPAREQLISWCADSSINTSLREVICLDAKKQGGNNGHDVGVLVTDFFSVKNDLEPRYFTIGDKNKIEIYYHDDSLCLGPCGGDGGEYETWFLAANDKYVGTIKLFSYWKNSSQAAWEEVEDAIYFYFYDDLKPLSNARDSKVVFKYNFTEEQFYVLNVSSPEVEDANVDEVTLENLTLRFTKGEKVLEELVLKPADFKLLKLISGGYTIQMLSDARCTYSECLD
ncbi:MAG: hypothetical protein JNK26_04335 [Candidatus Doudnabacteria bacterium]|nr:hypothetical protein [Candidatus Doudnabacteria bacterium]